MNSMGYWRRNEIAAIRIEVNPNPPVTPEEKEYQEYLAKRYSELIKHENRVLQRYDRFKNTMS